MHDEPLDAEGLVRQDAGRVRRCAINATERARGCGYTPLPGVWIDSTLRCMTVSSVVCPDPGAVLQHLPGSTCFQANGGMVARPAPTVNSNVRSDLSTRAAKSEEFPARRARPRWDARRW